MSENLSKDGHISPTGDSTRKFNFDQSNQHSKPQLQFKLQLVAEESSSHSERQNSMKYIDPDSILKDSLVEPCAEQVETNYETASPTKNSQNNSSSQKRKLSRTIDSNMDKKCIMDQSYSNSDKFEKQKHFSQHLSRNKNQGVLAHTHSMPVLDMISIDDNLTFNDSARNDDNSLCQISSNNRCRYLLGHATSSKPSADGQR